VKIPAALEGERLDRALQRLLTAQGAEVSVRELRRALRLGTVRVDGRAVAPGARARAEQEVDLGPLVPRASARIGPDAEVLARCRILHEDARLLALDKPSGVPTVPLAHEEPGTLVGAAVAHCPAIAEAGPPLEGGVLHRLDTATSGVVLFAKTVDDRARWRADFFAGRVVKRYLALVRDPGGRLDREQEIEMPLRGAGPRVRTTSPDDPEGQPARTAVRPRRRYADDVLLVEVHARTGRRHQVRVHLASVELPILGDPLYGPPDAAGPGRLALHAASVLLPGQPAIEAPLAADLVAYLERLGPE
jgi:23S rRNA pseudouridine1911/1915/1917 synthase